MTFTLLLRAVAATALGLSLSAPLVSVLSAQQAPAEAPPEAAPAVAPVPAVESVEAPRDRGLRRIDGPVHDDGDGRRRLNSGQNSRRKTAEYHDDFPLGSHTVPAGRTAHEILSIFGTTTVDGSTVDNAVTVRGDTIVNGLVQDDAVAVFGDVVVAGEVGEDVYAVAGDVHIDGRVGHEVWAYFGNVELGPTARVNGNVRVIFGRLVRAPGAQVDGPVTEFNPFSGPDGRPHPGLKAWINHALLWGRPLAFGSKDLRWVGLVGAGFVMLYVVLAIGFSAGIQRCADNLVQRPGRVIVAGVLGGLLAPIIVILLGATIVGMLAVPFLIAGLLLAILCGRAAVLAAIGRRFTRVFGDGAVGHPAFSVLVGGILVFVLYFVPFLGLLVWGLIGFLGFGAVTYTLLSGKPKPLQPQMATAGLTAPFARRGDPALRQSPPAASPEPAAVSPLGVGEAGAATPRVSAAETLVAATEPAARPSADPAEERAGFWPRMGSVALDCILVVVILAPMGIPELLVPALAVYGAVMWKLRGTTVGGAICGLRVIRLDGRPIDWPTAWVRSLGCLLSFGVFMLGFLWILFDRERQGWHDKVAGTIVIKTATPTPLV